MRRPRLRDSQHQNRSELYPLAEFPDTVIYGISKWIVYNFAVGKSDISGEDWGDIFAKSVDGDHLASPLGLGDVVLEGQAWTVKSVKNKNPHTCSSIRIISGRNSPDFSFDIENPRENIQDTGDAVLRIWNERVNIALDKFDSLRTCILIRNVNTLEFTLFETETHRYIPRNYVWRVNRNNNLEGYHIQSNKHMFTWQPHGSQFTIKHDVPVAAVRFKVRRPPILDFEKTMEQIGFNENWITIHPT